MKIGVINKNFKAGYSELYNALLLKLRNLKYAIRCRFSLIILTVMSEACKAFLSLSMAIYLIVSSKVRKWTVNLGWPFSLIFSMIEMILWWCFYFSIDTNTGFMQRSMLNREFSIGILNNIAKYSLNVLAVSVSELRISRFSNSFIFSLTVILSEKSGLTDFKNFLLSVIIFGSKFEKFFGFSQKSYI